MSDEKTREVPLTDVMGIAEVSDEPTETLPAVDDPGEAKTESFQKPFDGGPESRRVEFQRHEFARHRRVEPRRGFGAQVG